MRPYLSGKEGGLAPAPELKNARLRISEASRPSLPERRSDLSGLTLHAFIETRDQVFFKFSGSNRPKAFQIILGDECVSVFNRQRHFGNDPLVDIGKKRSVDLFAADHVKIPVQGFGQGKN